MTKIGDRVACSASQGFSQLRKLLLSTGPYSSLVVVVRRVFQRASMLVTEMEMQLEGLSVSRKKSILVGLVLDKIEELVDPEKGLAQQLGMPNKVWHYVAYTDLVVARVKDNTRQWAVYLLRDFPHTVVEEASLIDEEGWVLRTKLKTALKELGLVAGVQTEAEEDRIWFRITTVRKTKDRSKDMEKLYKAKPTLVVYYPGEPYMYSVLNLTEDLQMSLARCVGAKESKELPLTGRCVASLRRLRLGRDGREGPTDKARLGKERFTVVGREQEEGESQEEEEQPKLDKVTVSCETELEGTGDMLGMTMEVVGQNVIGGLMDLVDLGVIDKPAPMWVANLPTAGRNKFRLVEGGRAAATGREFDRGSVLSGM